MTCKIMKIGSLKGRVILFLAIVLPLVLKAQNKHYFFYRPEIDYGSEAVSNPLTLLLNGSYDVLRNGGHRYNGKTASVFQLDYRQGFRNVWDNITSPAYHINHYGWNRFLTQEVFPTSLDANKAQWLPNYGHHILGSGMLWVRTAEWFDYHGYPHPFWFSFVVTTAYQFMNEVLENNHSNKTNVDPIADILIFNPLGFLVFSSHAVRKFFSETVRMYDWSLQPVFNPFNAHLRNAGLQFAFKYQPHSFKRTALFLYYGIYGIGGISYRVKKDYHLSFGLGTVVNRLQEHIIHGSRLITPHTDGALGIFWDRNHSVLLSAILTGPRMYNARINVYPGLISIGKFSPGLFLAFGQWDHFVMGFTLARFPVGLAAGAGGK